MAFVSWRGVTPISWPIVTGSAMGVRLDPDRLDPVSSRERPFDSDVVAYGDLRMRHEMVARATVSALIGR
jgi:hypothetical protein